MKILWSEFASDTLSDIYKYYKEIAGKNLAIKIKKDIFSATIQLEKHPKSGHLEETLIKLGEGHRYLIQGNYKIVYKEVKEGILVTDVFDTRQDPIKLNDPKRTSGM
jgi:plasmid stabilization system protein ParE